MRYFLSLQALGVSAALMLAVHKMESDQISILLAALGGVSILGVVLIVLGVVFIRADVVKTQSLAARPPAPAQPPVIVMHGGRALPDHGAQAIAQRQPAQRQAQPARRPRQWGYVDNDR